ncbi:PucR family transcriptional regulator [Actinomadura craniellae]|uniref:PucR family transcriptional regulator n=1 Tax=Actinomadura craniellae TaxID=2231787 RepID=A0A365GWQ1_9ACTN|nr:helix-turn-helix domain-containing protein [Actinomadura craniellae]RAY11236.1 PucR family transcriptional regulator [Actinomadura craniellae]
MAETKSLLDSAEPWAEVPEELVVDLLPHMDAAAEEIVREIQHLVPEYARPLASEYTRRMREDIGQTVAHFVNALGDADASWEPLARLYMEVGAREAKEGRSLDGLQTAIRMSGQVACRRFIKDARRLEWPLQTLGRLTEALFVFMEKIASAAAQGYADAQGQIATERERSRWRLRDLLVADPPASREALVDLARSADWDPPRTIGVVALRPPAGYIVPVLPPVMLADWHTAQPYVIVPDPEGPGRERLIATLSRDCPAALGPAVPLTRGELSLRWARHALRLTERGVLPEQGMVRCLDHLPTLVTSMAEDLLGLAVSNRLSPLMQLPPHRREPLARTLLTYMESHDNAVAAADRLLVHEQTVRYRVRRVEDLLGGDLYDPEIRLEMMLLLHAWLRFEGRGSEIGPSPQPLT